MTNPIEEVKIRLYYNPRIVSTIVEYVASKNNITTEQLTKDFIIAESVHPTVFASLIDEADEQINEDLASWLKNQVGKTKDKLVSKYGIGASKDKANGNQQKRERITDLFKKWVNVAARANLKPSKKNLALYLNASEVPVAVTNNVIKQWTDMFDNYGILKDNELQSFFQNVAEKEQQDALNAMAGEHNPEYTAKEPEQQAPQEAPTQKQPAQATNNNVITAQQIEAYISKLSPEQRSQFVVNDVLSILSPDELAAITKELMFKKD